jgi:fido (protein-threonine AMPylation protein)
MDEWDAYFWPNSNVLKNKAGLTHAATLRSFEYEATRQRVEQLRAAPLQGRFTQTAYRFGPVALNILRPGNPSG